MRNGWRWAILVHVNRCATTARDWIGELPSEEPPFTVEDLAEYLSVPVGTVYAWNYRGTGPKATRVGRFVRYRRPDVTRWLDERAAKSPA